MQRKISHCYVNKVSIYWPSLLLLNAAYLINRLSMKARKQKTMRTMAVSSNHQQGNILCGKCPEGEDKNLKDFYPNIIEKGN